MSPPGTITTPIDLINQCFQISSIFGQGQTPAAADINRAFIQLNAMIAIWNRSRWLLFHNIDVSVVGTGAQTYTVGIGGDINVPRPDRLEAAYVRLNPSSSSPVDFPLGIVPSMENYSQISLKKLNSFPGIIFYDSGFPLGTIYPYPIPNSFYEIHIIIKDVLTAFATLTTEISLPPEYTDALIWNLSTRIRTLYGQAPDPSIVALAKVALNAVRGANTQISSLNFPGDMPGNGAGNFDPTMGQWNGLPFGSF